MSTPLALLRLTTCGVVGTAEDAEYSMRSILFFFVDAKISGASFKGVCGRVLYMYDSCIAGDS